jgi:uncharacterized protein (TIGR02145 family)
MKKSLLIFVLALTAQTIQSQTVVIGNQTWTTKNLDVTTYSDGTPIPKARNNEEWANSTTGAWCYFEDLESLGKIHGKLYNWYAVAGIYDEVSKKDISKRKKLAPEGWHVPSNTEWTTLTTFLGGEKVAGGKMKEKGSEIWASPNVSATNSSGFTAIPGSYRYGNVKNQILNGIFSPSIVEDTYFWSSTEVKMAGTAYARGLNFTSSVVFKGPLLLSNGLSVRCIKD